MKRNLFRTLSVAVVTLGLVLSAKLAWQASSSETGWAALCRQWRNHSAGLFLGPHESISHREPSVQAEFWLKEVDRVVSLHPEDPMVLLGASMVLDSPGNDFVSEYRDTSSGIHSLDNNAIFEAEQVFTRTCNTRCLQLAAQACELNPQNKSLWQSRALLLTNYSTFGGDGSPRSDDWETVIQDCITHDPDNALYDYIAAAICLEGIFEYEFTESDYEPDHVIILDNDRFATANQWLENGLTKSSYSVDDTLFEATWAFLVKSRLPRIDYDETIKSRFVQPRQFYSLLQFRELGNIARERAYRGDPAAAFGEFRRLIRICDQAKRGGLRTKNDYLVHTFAAMHLTEHRSLLNQYADVLLPPEHAEQTYCRQFHELLILKLLEEDNQAREKAQQAKRKWTPTRTVTSMPMILVASIMQQMTTIMLLLSALALFVLWRWRTRDANLPHVGSWVSTMLFLVAIGLSITLFGLAPANVITQESQKITFTLGAFLGIFLTVVELITRWLRRRQYRLSLRAILVLMTLLCLVVALLSTWKKLGAFTLPFDWFVPRNEASFDSLSRYLRKVPTTPAFDNLIYIGTQWMAYRGPMITVAMWFAALLLLTIRKIENQRKKSNGTAWKSIPVSLANSLKLPSLLFAGIFFVIYLVLAPIAVEIAEEDFQILQTYHAAPNATLQQIDESIERMKQDPAKMAWLYRLVTERTTHQRDEAVLYGEEATQQRRRIQFPDAHSEATNE